MSIVYHGNPTTGQQGWTAQNGSLTFAHTHTAGRDLILCTVLGLGAHSSGTVAPTYDGVSLSELAQKMILGYPGQLHAYHRLPDPGSKTANIVIPATTTDSIKGFVAWVLEVSGLSATPIGASNQSADDHWTGSLAFSIAATLQATDSLTLAMMGVKSGAGTAISLASPLTQIGTLEETSDSNAPLVGLGYKLSDGAGSKTYTGSWAGSSAYEQASVLELKAASASIPSKPRVIWI